MRLSLGWIFNALVLKGLLPSSYFLFQLCSVASGLHFTVTSRLESPGLLRLLVVFSKRVRPLKDRQTELNAAFYHLPTPAALPPPDDLHPRVSWVSISFLSDSCTLGSQLHPELSLAMAPYCSSFCPVSSHSLGNQLFFLILITLHSKCQYIIMWGKTAFPTRSETGNR